MIKIETASLDSLKAEIKVAQDALKEKEKKNESYLMPTDVEQELEKLAQQVSEHRVRLMTQRQIN